MDVASRALHASDLIGPVVGAIVFILLMSLVREPERQRFNAIFVVGAGAAYLNGGLGLWEFPFIVVATVAAYLGLRSYRFIGVAWMLHVGWDRRIANRLLRVALRISRPLQAERDLRCALM